MPDSTIERWIEPDPYRPGAQDARVREYGVAVWALIGHLQAVGGNLQRVAADYELPLEAVQAAVAYYQHHREVISARIAANQPATAAEHGQLLC
uniref:DUF433 domain-containing protein n=1 Tax=Thermorudis sp. TaxID=1969470 RepID=A0A7C3APJ3_9BACT